MNIIYKHIESACVHIYMYICKTRCIQSASFSLDLSSLSFYIYIYICVCICMAKYGFCKIEWLHIFIYIHLNHQVICFWSIGLHINALIYICNIMQDIIESACVHRYVFARRDTCKAHIPLSLSIYVLVYIYIHIAMEDGFKVDSYIYKYVYI